MGTNPEQYFVGKMLPALNLETLDGTYDNTAHYRNRFHLMMVLAPSGSLDMVSKFLEDLSTAFDDELPDSTCMLIVSDSRRLLENLSQEFRREAWQYRIMQDPMILDRLLTSSADIAVIIIDRFGEIRAHYLGTDQIVEVSPQEVFAELAFINLECPE